MDKIAVLIPCYNESQTIEKVVRDYKAALPEAEIYVYDNNSTDGTDELARKAGATVRYERRQGKGNVIRSMFRDIDADCYLMIDGDDTYPAENAREMCDLVLSKNADMVVGDRLSSTYFSKILNVSATPKLSRGQNPDVEIKEQDAINAKLIKNVEWNTEECEVSAALEKFENIKDSYRDMLGVNPCLIIQISNKDKAT